MRKIALALLITFGMAGAAHAAPPPNAAPLAPRDMAPAIKQWTRDVYTQHLIQGRILSKRIWIKCSTTTSCRTKYDVNVPGEGRMTETGIFKGCTPNKNVKRNGIQFYRDGGVLRAKIRSHNIRFVCNLELYEVSVI